MKKKSLMPVAIAVVIAVAVAGAFFIFQPTQPTARGAESSASAPEEVSPEDLISVLPPDSIPAIDNPRFISATKAEEGDIRLRDDDAVLGVALGGIAKAYPIRILNWHEIVNDEISGKPVLITFCPLCATGIAFDPVVDGRRLTFGTSGKLFNSDLVMYDRQTNSLWSQISGTAVTGELKGKRIKFLPAEPVRWVDWKKAHPNTLVLSGSFECSQYNLNCRRNYNINPYEGYERSEAIQFPVDNTDSRLPNKELVTGIEISGKFKAYQNRKVLEIDAFEDEFAGVKLRVEADPATRAVKIFRADTNAQLDAIQSFWFAWVAFHPGTGLWTG